MPDDNAHYVELQSTPHIDTTTASNVNGNGNEFWTSTWAKDDTFWQVSDVHPMLLKYLPHLLGSSNIDIGGTLTLQAAKKLAQGKKIFIPLCGKTHDIGYLLSLGFKQIFAIEYVKKAIEELEEENKFGLKFNQNESVFSTPDGRLVIYNGDMFECPVEKWGPFDCIWDRASFIAIDYSVRAKYADVIRRSVMDATGNQIKFRYLQETFNYGPTLFAGPPRAVTMDDLREHFGPWAQYDVLEVTALPDEHFMRQVMQMIPTTCVITIFTPISRSKTLHTARTMDNELQHIVRN